MKTRLREVSHDGFTYQALMFWCPGCEVMVDGERQRGAHMLPVLGEVVNKPKWDWDGNLERPTLTPSILTKMGPDDSFVCHSHLTDGNFVFLSDCTHKYAGQTVPMPELPDWLIDL